MCFRVISLGHDGKDAIPAGSLSETARTLDAAKQLARLRYPQVKAGWYGAKHGVRILDCTGQTVGDLTVSHEHLEIRDL
jgi:hypothetical protein